MKSNQLRSGKKPLLISAGVILLFAALLTLQSGTQESVAQSRGVEYIFDVVPNNATLTSLPAKGTTFYLEGTLYPFRTVNMADCTFNATTARQVGTWRAWGTVADDGRIVLNQSLVGSWGTIEMQGVSGILSAGGGVTPAIPGTVGPPFTGPTEVVAVTGGVGAYRGIGGEARIRSYCSDPTAPFRYDRAFCIQIIESCCGRK